MNKVKVITDSTSDLPYSMMKERGIDMVPLHIILGDKSFLDDNSLSNKDLFLYADKFNVLPKSAAVNEYQFTETFKKWLEEGYDIVFIGISSKLSATVQNAIVAAR
jgi:DegV family protein with EDD domain